MAVEQITSGVWRAGTRYVNWYMVDAGGDGLTLIDAGLPGYSRRMHAALGQLGRRVDDVRHVVLTHGHIDHVGLTDELARTGASIHLHPADVALARDPRKASSDRSLLPYLLWPATFAFVAHCVTNGAFDPPDLPDPVPLTTGRKDDIPGSPLVVHTPGHTDGSCVIEFSDHDVVFVGDLLCTVSPFSGKAARPQLQTRASNRDSDQAMASLGRLEELSARTVLPGHGGPWRDGIEAAVRSARRTGCR